MELPVEVFITLPCAHALTHALTLAYALTHALTLALTLALTHALTHALTLAYVHAPNLDELAGHSCRAGRSHVSTYRVRSAA